MKKNFRKITNICYLGIYNYNSQARDKVFLEGLCAQDWRVISCVDNSKKILKYWRLFKKYRNLNTDCNFIWVGYLSGLLVPLAKIISTKKIVFNAGNSKYESVILDRRKYHKFSFRSFSYWLTDFLSFHLADLILVETEEQKKFLISKFKLKKEKLAVIFTGVDETVFYYDPKVRRRNNFTVVFRGWFLPATGVEYVIKAANILKNEQINFLIIGRGMLEKKIKKLISAFNLKNIELITEFLPSEKLREEILSCYIMLGQFSAHARLERTIQNKTFEALALKLPYITRKSKSNTELLEDKKNCLFVRPANAQDIAKKIIKLKKNPSLREKIAYNGYQLYLEKLTQKVLTKKLLKILACHDIV